MYLSNPKHIKINKPLIGQLFASGLLCFDDKFILEIIAPRDIIRMHEEYDYSNMNIGEQWELNLKDLAKSRWPLENSSYHIEINGINIGEDEGNSTRYKYEPEHEEKDGNHSGIPEKIPDEDFAEFELKPTENGLYIPDVSEQIKNLFENQDFVNTLATVVESLPPVNPDNPADTSNHEDYFKKKKKEDELFFSELRSNTYIPNYLRDRSIVFAECIFKGKNLLTLVNEIRSLKFIMKNTTKYLLIRERLVLPFGECLIQVKSHEWGTYTGKIWLEGIVESTREEGKIKNMPAGKKAVFIRYETFDNVLVQPLFYTTEMLMSYNIDDCLVLNKTKKLEEKGKKGFNQYITFAGYVDEDAGKADFELFQLIVTHELNKEYVLIG